MSHWLPKLKNSQLRRDLQKNSMLISKTGVRFVWLWPHQNRGHGCLYSYPFESIFWKKKTGPIKLELLRVLMDTESKSFCKLVLFIHSPAPLCNVFSVIKGQGAKVELLCHSGGEWIWLGVSYLLLSISYWKGWGYADLKTHSCPGSLIQQLIFPFMRLKICFKTWSFCRKKKVLFWVRTVYLNRNQHFFESSLLKCVWNHV